MDLKFEKSLYNAIKMGIEKALKENKGIEKDLDWFSIRAENKNKKKSD